MLVGPWNCKEPVVVEVIPSIDIREGRCVRLYQGDYDRETVFSNDPVEMARRWQDEGGARLHVVDLDGAATGQPANLPIIWDILEALSIPVQVGGGIRSLDAVRQLIEAGVDRVVLGTAAVRDPDMVQEICRSMGGERVIVAADARDGKVAVEGWREGTSVEAADLIADMEKLGVVRFLYTDISRDGAMTQPNFQAYRELVASIRGAVIASGGVSSLEHLRQLAEIGTEGAILGSALYRGALELSQAVYAMETLG